MLKNRSHEEYLKWWNYWNSKIPKGSFVVERVISTAADSKLGSKTYRERVHRQLMEIRSLHDQPREPSLDLDVLDGVRYSERSNSRIGGWEE